jgi:hypothetical protein
MRRHGLAAACAALLALAGHAAPARAQAASQRGFLEASGIVYPQTAPTGGDQWIGEALFRQEASWRPSSWLTLAGAFDARAATDNRVDASWSIDWSDRGRQRPALSIRRASAAFRRGGFTVEAGKQFVRWGKADVLNPTDRFAPRDLLEVVDNEFLGITAVRATYEHGADTVDVVWQPRFTPSRLPLPGSRWSGSLPSGSSALAPAGGPSASLPLVDAGAQFPERPQAGVRWNHVGGGFEFSLSLFDGFNYLPIFGAVPDPAQGQTAITRLYPVMRMAGGDAAWPLRWFSLKGEIGYFWTTDQRVDDYGIYVIQLERQHGDWLFVGGYAGEFVTTDRGLSSATPAFAFDRELTRTFLGRASYTIDANRSVAFEGAVRQDLSGGWLKAEYSQAFGQHWRATVRGDALGGEDTDFFGRYRRNSNVRLTVRYSY